MLMVSPTNANANVEPSQMPSSFSTFIHAADSPYTKRTYRQAFTLFLKFHKMDLAECDQILQLDKQKTTEMIRDFIVYQKDERKLSRSRVNVYFAAIKLFYEMNDYSQDLNWSRLAKFKGNGRKNMVKDRLYSKEEIGKLMTHADLRMKVVVLTFLSTGMRVGGLAAIRMKDLKYIEAAKLYRITVYSSDLDDTYITFCTPECAAVINEYIDYRKRMGEEIKDESPLIRQKFDMRNSIEAINDIKAVYMTPEDIQEAMRQLLIKSGYLQRSNRDPNRKMLTEQDKVEIRRKRNDVMRCHSFRKMFNTLCIDNGVSLSAKERMLGHKAPAIVPMDSHYYRPSPESLLTEYLKVMDALTVNDEFRLSKQVQELQKKNENKDYVIASKIREKDEQILKLQDQIDELKNLSRFNEAGDDFSAKEKQYLRYIIKSVGSNIGPEVREYTKKYADYYFGDNTAEAEELSEERVKLLNDLIEVENRLFHKNTPHFTKERLEEIEKFKRRIEQTAQQKEDY